MSRAARAASVDRLVARHAGEHVAISELHRILQIDLVV